MLAAGGKKVFLQKLLLRIKGEILSMKESSSPERLIRKAQSFLDKLEAQVRAEETDLIAWAGSARRAGPKFGP